MDADTIRDVMAEAMPDLRAAVRETLLKRVSEHVGWSLSDPVKAQIEKFLAEEIAPEIAKALASQKGAIIVAVQDAACQIGATLAAAMVKNSIETLTGYNGKELISKLVGGR